MSEEKFAPEEIAEHRAEWIAALRSGDYEQGKNGLKDESGRMCCLGVAEVLAGSECSLSGGDYVFGPERVRFYLSQRGRSWLGVETDNPLCDGEPLAKLNDIGKSFKAIADLVEANGISDKPAKVPA